MFKTITAFFLCLSVVSCPPFVWAHCDTLDGPVVTAAKAALDSGDPARVLIWVQKEDEAAVNGAFHKTMEVRKLGANAKELAETYFYETVVRLHRAGEGESFSGLKAAGKSVHPMIRAVDKAVEAGDASALAEAQSKRLAGHILRRFHEIKDAIGYSHEDVEGGRRFVKSYVSFVHFMLELDAALTQDHPEEAHAGRHEELEH